MTLKTIKNLKIRKYKIAKRKCTCKNSDVKQMKEYKRGKRSY